jgi:hypothetical protein
MKRKEEVHKRLEEADTAEKTEDLQTAEKLVESALELDPTDTQARMMMVALKRRLGQQSREAELTQLSELAKKAISQHRFTGAHDVIRRMEALEPTYPEIAALKEQAVTEHSKQEEQRKFVDGQLGKANRMVADGQLQEALALLQEAVKQSPQERRLEAAIGAVKEQIKLAASMAPPPPAAATRAVPATAATRPGAAGGTVAVPSPARPAAAPPRAAAPARVAHPLPVPEEKSSKGLIIGVLAAVLVIGGAVGGYFALRPKTATAPVASGTTGAATTVAAGPSSLQINAIPWGTVKSITDSTGKAIEASGDTPLRVDLPSGAYEVVVVGPDGKTEKRNKIVVPAGQPQFMSFEFQQVDAKKIVDAY